MFACIVVVVGEWCIKWRLVIEFSDEQGISISQWWSRCVVMLLGKKMNQLSKLIPFLGWSRDPRRRAQTRKSLIISLLRLEEIIISLWGDGFNLQPIILFSHLCNVILTPSHSLSYTNTHTYTHPHMHAGAGGGSYLQSKFSWEREREREKWLAL